MNGFGARWTKGLRGSPPRQRSPESEDVEAAEPRAIPADPAAAATFSSEAWASIARDPALLEDPSWVVGTVERLVVDDPLAATNIVIALRDRRYFARGRQVVAEILAACPEYPFALHEAAVIEMRQRRNQAALPWAERAAAAAPDNLSVRVQHAYLLGANGRPRQGVAQLDGFVPRTADEHEHLIYAIQFLEFTDRFPFETVDRATQGLVRQGPFRTAPDVRHDILNAVRDRRPYALIRLGDGEGAWTFTGGEDEARYPCLYRRNRAAFLADWFGSDEWLTSSAFYNFARRLDDVVPHCDLVGIGEHRRMFDEYELIGTRGLPGQVNLLRRLGVLPRTGAPWAVASTARFCSSFVNNELVGTGFYPELLNSGAPVGVITSHRPLADLLSAAGARVEHVVHVPGDTRNPWRDEAGGHVRQWPEAFEHTQARIRSLDLAGTVFLVSAGFVGKQYLPVLKAQGAVALDIGAVTDLWVGRGVVS